MKKILFFLLVILGTSSAYADILFFDLNFSINEVRAIRKFAQSKNETLHLYPERSLQDESLMEKEWRAAEALQSQLLDCVDSKKDCSALREKANAAMNRMHDLVSKKVKMIDPSEIKRIINDLGPKNINLSTIIFSGHSGGPGFTGLFGGLSLTDIEKPLKANPELIRNTHSFLLWGCYSGTLNSLYNIWKKSFPEINTFAGYEKRAPLGIRETSAKYLINFLSAEDSLAKAQTVQEAHRLFKKIDLTADLDGTALVGDYYLTYDEGASVAEMLKRCDQFPESLYQQFQCYDKAQAGCENPPANHQGPIREFYTFLQVNRHCYDLLKTKYPELPTPDYLIRLIYLDNIKINFENQHKKDYQVFNQNIDSLGFSKDYYLENFIHENRKSNIDLINSYNNEFNQLGVLDGSIANNERIYDLIISQLVFQNITMGPLNIFDAWFFRNGEPPMCIPFSWVDIGASEPDTCNITSYLTKPANKDVERDIHISLLWYQLTNAFFNVNPSFANYAAIPTLLEEQRSNYINSINQQLKIFNSVPLEKQSKEIQKLLLLYPQWINQVNGMSDREYVQKALTDIEQLKTFLHKKISNFPKDETYQKNIEYYLEYLENCKQILLKLISL